MLQAMPAHWRGDAATSPKDASPVDAWPTLTSLSSSAITSSGAAQLTRSPSYDYGAAQLTRSPSMGVDVDVESWRRSADCDVLEDAVSCGSTISQAFTQSSLRSLVVGSTLSVSFPHSTGIGHENGSAPRGTMAKPSKGALSRACTAPALAHVASASDGDFGLSPPRHSVTFLERRPSDARSSSSSSSSSAPSPDSLPSAPSMQRRQTQDRAQPQLVAAWELGQGCNAAVGIANAALVGSGGGFVGCGYRPTLNGGIAIAFPFPLGQREQFLSASEWTVELWEYRPPVASLVGDYCILAAEGRMDTASGPQEIGARFNFVQRVDGTSILTSGQKNVPLASCRAALIDDGWNHHAIIFTTSNVLWYINGDAGMLLDRVICPELAMIGNSQDLNLGDSSSLVRFKKVCLYRGALSADEIRADCARGESNVAWCPRGREVPAEVIPCEFGKQFSLLPAPCAAPQLSRLPAPCTAPQSPRVHRTSSAGTPSFQQSSPAQPSFGTLSPATTTDASSPSVLQAESTSTAAPSQATVLQTRGSIGADDGANTVTLERMRSRGSVGTVSVADSAVQRRGSLSPLHAASPDSTMQNRGSVQAIDAPNAAVSAMQSCGSIGAADGANAATGVMQTRASLGAVLASRASASVQSGGSTGRKSDVAERMRLLRASAGGVAPVRVANRASVAASSTSQESSLSAEDGGLQTPVAGRKPRQRMSNRRAAVQPGTEPALTWTFVHMEVWTMLWIKRVWDAWKNAKKFVPAVDNQKRASLLDELRFATARFSIIQPQVDMVDDAHP